MALKSSLSINPPNAQLHIHSGGSFWLWTVAAIFAAGTLGMVAWSFTRTRGTRLWHNIAAVMLVTSTIAYLAMASDLGATPVVTELRGHQTRQIWYVRYIQWFINFPLLLFMLLFTTALSLSDILTTGFFAWVTVVCGLAGALTPTRYKWGFFVLGVCALLYVWTVLLAHAPRTTFPAGQTVRAFYLGGSRFIAFVLLLYPVAWGCAEGGNVVSPTKEVIWYGILDLLLGLVFVFYFVWSLRGVDYAQFGLHSGKFTDGPYGTNGMGYGEKPTHHGHHHGRGHV